MSEARMPVLDMLEPEGTRNPGYLMVGTCDPVAPLGRYHHVTLWARPRLGPINPQDRLDDAVQNVRRETYFVGAVYDAGLDRRLDCIILATGQSPVWLKGFVPSGAENLWHPDDGYPEGIAQVLPALDDAVLARMRREPKFRHHVLSIIAAQPENAIMSFGRQALGGYLRGTYSDMTVRHPKATVLTNLGLP
jgi:hypothetical protein